jgi:hypothetical protein
VSTTFNALPFVGDNQFTNNTIVRGGGMHYGQQIGALRFFADTQPVTNVTVTNTEVKDLTYLGIQFDGAQTYSNTIVQTATVEGQGTIGIWATSQVYISAKSAPCFGESGT